MAFFSRKESALDRRLKALDKELARVQGSLKAAAVRGAPPRRPAVAPAAARPTAPEPVVSQPTPAPAEPESPAAPAQPAPPPPDTFFPHLPKTRTAPPQTSSEPDLFSSAGRGEGDPNPANRHRFASYFMAGHFQDLRPMRQERRVQRNKAIVTVVVTLLVLAWLSYWFLW